MNETNEGLLELIKGYIDGRIYVTRESIKRSGKAYPDNGIGIRILGATLVSLIDIREFLDTLGPEESRDD